MLAENKALYRLWQVNRLSINENRRGCQLDYLVFDLNLDRCLTAVWLTVERMVDRHFVLGLFTAVLYHRISSFSREGKCLLIKSDIMLPSPSHAHGMIMELVLIVGSDFVQWHSLVTCRAHVTSRAEAGVRFYAPPTIFTSCLTDRYITLRSGV
jgi:hypothetical protein